MLCAGGVLRAAARITLSCRPAYAAPDRTLHLVADPSARNVRRAALRPQATTEHVFHVARAHSPTHMVRVSALLATHTLRTAGQGVREPAKPATRSTPLLSACHALEARTSPQMGLACRARRANTARNWLQPRAPAVQSGSGLMRWDIRALCAATVRWERSLSPKGRLTAHTVHQGGTSLAA